MNDIKTVCTIHLSIDVQQLDAIFMWTFVEPHRTKPNQSNAIAGWMTLLKQRLQDMNQYQEPKLKALTKKIWSTRSWKHTAKINLCTSSCSYGCLTFDLCAQCDVNVSESSYNSFSFVHFNCTLNTEKSDVNTNWRWIYFRRIVFFLKSTFDSNISGAKSILIEKCLGFFFLRYVGFTL